MNKEILDCFGGASPFSFYEKEALSFCGENGFKEYKYFNVRFAINIHGFKSGMNYPKVYVTLFSNGNSIIRRHSYKSLGVYNR